MSFNLRTASEADAQEIADLVNSAYRPTFQGGGWTHEGDLVSGARTTVDQINELLHGQSVVLLYCLETSIVACVHVSGDSSGVCVGLLATRPNLQDQGLGKQMLLHAEQYASENFKASVCKISVLSSRPELLAFYERRGYILTGHVEEYPVAAGVGSPIVDGIKVLSLEKILS